MVPWTYIRVSVFAEFTVMTNTQTDTQTHRWADKISQSATYGLRNHKITTNKR